MVAPPHACMLSVHNSGRRDATGDGGKERFEERDTVGNKPNVRGCLVVHILTAVRPDVQLPDIDIDRCFKSILEPAQIGHLRPVDVCFQPQLAVVSARG